MRPGVYPAKKTDGTPYFRASLTFRGKHISLGSFSTEAAANRAYRQGKSILTETKVQIDDHASFPSTLPLEKLISLLNFRDRGLYFKTPIYLRTNYFEYYLAKDTILKFDIDDLFFYSSHKVQRRGNHLFVSEYGMQTGILTRYGIKAYAVAGKDYVFANGDPTDYRYANILIKNAYYGVEQLGEAPGAAFRSKIHINGNYIVGVYDTAEKAAIAYNKAVDLAKDAGIRRNYSQNYLESLSAREYADIYTALQVSKDYLSYLSGLPAQSEA
ncbi:MAG: hypothetical protein IJJ13_04215 [Lachnospiraceae bacterium]|nr:hypothetical protein [Lachnospiraceae bacterium]